MVEEVIPEQPIKIVDEIPETEDVIEQIEDDALPDHPTVMVEHPTGDVVLTEEEIKNAKVVEVENPRGDTLEVIVIEDPEPKEVIETDEATI